MEPESENRDLVHVEASSTPTTETDADIALLIRKVGATSIAEIEKLIGELQETKNFLQSEADRIERETARYMNLTQMALASVKIIFGTVSEWRQAGHPMREFEIMRSPAKGTLFRDDEMIALVRACGNAAKIGSNPRQAADRLSEDGQARDHLRHRDHRAGRPHATA